MTVFITKTYLLSPPCALTIHKNYTSFLITFCGIKWIVYASHYIHHNT